MPLPRRSPSRLHREGVSAQLIVSHGARSAHDGGHEGRFVFSGLDTSLYDPQCLAGETALDFVLANAAERPGTSTDVTRSGVAKR